MIFTDFELAKAQPRESEYLLREKGSKGFTFRVKPNGTKTFLYIHQVAKRRHKVTIGTFPAMSANEARTHWANLRAPTAALPAYLTPKTVPAPSYVPETVPQTVPAPTLRVPETVPAPSYEPATTVLSLTSSQLTIKEAYRLWYSKKLHGAYAATTIKQYGDYIHELAELVGDIPCDQLLPTTVEDLCDELDEQYAVKGNRMRAAISSLYKWLRKQRVDGRRLVTVNPAAGLEYKREIPKTRKLPKRELKYVLQLLSESRAHPSHTDLVRLALLTGQRPTELCGLCAEEVDLAEGRWILPAERAKNRREHLIPLSPAAARILKPYLIDRFSGPIFIDERGQPVKSYAVRQALRRIMTRGGLEPCSMHDLRRTAAHHMNSIGVDASLIADILNHSKGGVTQKSYIQAALYDNEKPKRDALNAWAETLISWASPEITHLKNNST